MEVFTVEEYSERFDELTKRVEEGETIGRESHSSQQPEGADQGGTQETATSLRAKRVETNAIRRADDQDLFQEVQKQKC